MTLLLLLLSVPARADDLESAWAASRALEADDPAAACDLLAPWRAVYPQDYALALRIGWLAFQAGRYDQAEQAYRAAHDLSGGAPDAVLGLAWTALRQGDRAEARRWLAALPEDDARGDELRGALIAPPWSRARVGGSFTSIPDGGGPSSVSQIRAGIDAGWAPLSVGADAQAWIYPGTASVDLDLWGRAGLDGRWFGVEAVGAGLLRTLDAQAVGWVGGGIVRAHLPVDVRFEGSMTRPRAEGDDALRFALSAWAPAGPVALEPAVSTQVIAGQPLLSGGATFWLVPDGVGLWAGGRYGSQRYASLLGLGAHTAWSVPERGAAWAGLRLGAFERTWVSTGWTGTWVQTAEPTDARPPTWGLAHTVEILIRPAL